MKQKINPQDVFYYTAIAFGITVIVMGVLAYVAKLIVAVCQ